MVELKRLLLRKPDAVIGDNYLYRWFLIPHNKIINVYLHKFVGSDDDRALHDHPWWSISLLLKGNLTEVRKNKPPRRPQWMAPILRKPTDAHRLINKGPPCWTLFITGPHVRQWGFHCPTGWKHWRTMTDENGNKTGGC